MAQAHLQIGGTSKSHRLSLKKSKSHRCGKRNYFKRRDTQGGNKPPPATGEGLDCATKRQDLVEASISSKHEYRLSNRFINTRVTFNWWLRLKKFLDKQLGH
jgi:hypothetical protein